jgi:hypothetical protein
VLNSSYSSEIHKVVCFTQLNFRQQGTAKDHRKVRSVSCVLPEDCVCQSVAHACRKYAPAWQLCVGVGGTSLNAVPLLDACSGQDLTCSSHDE